MTPRSLSPAALLHDQHFQLALLAAPAGLLALYLTSMLPISTVVSAWMIISLCLVYPVVEELLFRGIIQPYLSQHRSRRPAIPSSSVEPWARSTVLGISYANILTSILFAMSHMLYQPITAALLVFVPSLIFGHFRDRYQSTIPCIILHAYYNASLLAMSFMT